MAIPADPDRESGGHLQSPAGPRSVVSPQERRRQAGAAPSQRHVAVAGRVLLAGQRHTELLRPQRAASVQDRVRDRAPPRGPGDAQRRRSRAAHASAAGPRRTPAVDADAHALSVADHGAPGARLDKTATAEAYRRFSLLPDLNLKMVGIEGRLNAGDTSAVFDLEKNLASFAGASAGVNRAPAIMGLNLRGDLPAAHALARMALSETPLSLEGGLAFQLAA